MQLPFHLTIVGCNGNFVSQTAPIFMRLGSFVRVTGTSTTNLPSYGARGRSEVPAMPSIRVWVYSVVI